MPTIAQTNSRPRRTPSVAVPSKPSKASPHREAWCVTFETQLQWMAVSWTQQRTVKLLATSFGRMTENKVIAAIEDSTSGWDVTTIPLDETPAEITALVGRLVDYARGQDAGDFRDVRLDLTGRTDFQTKVLQHCQRIAPGHTATYGQLAKKAGSPRAARAAGTVMSGNRLPLVVPCHRVVGGDGQLHGFSAPDGVDMKRRLLDMEANRRLLDEA